MYEAKIKFQNDTKFRHLTEGFAAMLGNGDFTPRELRQAVILACSMNESKLYQTQGTVKRIDQLNSLMIFSNLVEDQIIVDLNGKRVKNNGEEIK